MSALAHRAVDRFHTLLEDSDLRDDAVLPVSTAVARGAGHGPSEQTGAPHDEPEPWVGLLRPALLDRATWDRVRRASFLVVGAIRTAAARLQAEPATLEQVIGAVLPIDPEILALDLSRDCWTFARLDAFVSPGGAPRFVECNAQWGGRFPSASGEARLVEGFDRTEILRRMRREFRLSTIDVVGRQVEALVRRGSTMAVIVDRALGPLHLLTDESGSMLRDARARGVDVAIVDAAELVFDGEHLRTPDGDAVSTLFVMKEAELLGAREASWFPAYVEGRLDLPGGIELGRLASNKAMFELLSDPAYTLWFDPETRAALAACVPWTRRVRDTAATVDGRRVDLLAWVIDHREVLVLKPATSYGGDRVFIGSQTDGAVWAEAVRQAAADGAWVVQQRIDVATAPYPVVRPDGRVELVPLLEDLDPFVWADGADGAMVRASTTLPTSVTFGNGWANCLFVVEEAC